MKVKEDVRKWKRRGGEVEGEREKDCVRKEEGRKEMSDRRRAPRREEKEGKAKLRRGSRN